jgi:hypothetical protein
MPSELNTFLLQTGGQLIQSKSDEKSVAQTNVKRNFNFRATIAARWVVLPESI